MKKYGLKGSKAKKENEAIAKSVHDRKQVKVAVPPEQVMAVIELLDDLRERIWSHYETVLLDKFKRDRVTGYNLDISDPPF